MIKILIADDHKVLVDGFVALFEKVDDFQVIGTVNNGKEVLNTLSTSEVDIVLMDINMPVLNGVETCKRISKKYPNIKVIALSMYREASFVKRMKQNGAKGYILKDDSADTIIEAIHEIYKGKEYYSDQLKNILYNQVFTKRSTNTTAVTKREKEVLALIAEGMTNKEIGKKLFVSDHTIISHRKNLIEKFDAKNTAELVKLAIEKGII